MPTSDPINDEIWPRFQSGLDILTNYKKQLELASMTYGKIINFSRTGIIFLGALIAAKGQFDVLQLSVELLEFAFALLGVAVATISGLEAAFKWDQKLVAATRLSSKCQSLQRKHSTVWTIEIRSTVGEGNNYNKSAKARELLSSLEEDISIVSREAVEEGIALQLLQSED